MPLKEPHRLPLAVQILCEKQPCKKLDHRKRVTSVTEVKLYVYVNRINLLVFQNMLFLVLKGDNETKACALMSVYLCLIFVHIFIFNLLASQIIPFNFGMISMTKHKEGPKDYLEKVGD